MKHEKKKLIFLSILISIIFTSSACTTILSNTRTTEASEPNYLCTSTGVGMYCDRLSSTQVRCYPTTGTTLGYKDCATKWSPITPTPSEPTVPTINYKATYIYKDTEWYLYLPDEKKCLQSGLTSKKVDCP